MYKFCKFCDLFVNFLYIFSCIEPVEVMFISVLVKVLFSSARLGMFFVKCLKEPMKFLNSLYVFSAFRFSMASILITYSSAVTVNPSHTNKLQAKLHLCPKAAKFSSLNRSKMGFSAIW